MEAGFAQYLKQFTSSSTLGDSAGKVFLLRNLPDRREPDAEAAAEAAHAGARLVNGLECKLSCSTSKVRHPPMPRSYEPRYACTTTLCARLSDTAGCVIHMYSQRYCVMQYARD